MPFLRTICILAATAAVTGFVAMAQHPSTISGTVTDQNGSVIAGATVRFRVTDGSHSAETRTDANGHFRMSFNVPVRGRLIVLADGFARVERQLQADGLTDITFTLSPAQPGGTVTVTGSETRIDETAASIVAIGRQDIETAAGATLDDKLREVPGFTLFRRAGSRTANPTTQGVSLRGVGASGASRALVLADGLPLNDSFGGWIYWGRVPVTSIAQVEILRGPASDLYGSAAISGAVSIVTRKPKSESVLSLDASYGAQQTSLLSGYASAGISKWRGSASAEVFVTDGSIPVVEAARGPVDTPANDDRAVYTLRIERVFDGENRIYGTSEHFEERRANGTPLQENDTNLRNFSLGADWMFERFGRLNVRGYGSSQAYHQSFSSVAATRQTESLIRLQSVPSQMIGLDSQWTGSLSKNILIAGLDLRVVRGRSDETAISGGRAVMAVSAGGRESTLAVFGGAVFPIRPRITVSGGLRYDRWQNSDGYSASRSLVSTFAGLTNFSGRKEWAVSPRASLLYRASDNVSFAATFATAFRRPTLNELYRGFRVGDVLTLANENLRAERATTGEGASVITGFGQRLYFRAGVYCTEISRSVSNVTLSVTPTLITRQRQNLGRTRSCGAEIDTEIRPADHVRVSAGYLFVNSRVVEFPADRELEDLRIPQVARHQFTIRTEYSDPKYATAAVQVRANTPQFDDDRNLLPLRGFWTTDLYAARRLGRQAELYFAAENVFDAKIESGRTPVLTLASPRTFRLGLRLRFGKN